MPCSNDERVIVELDGWDFHNDRRTFEADRSRDADTLVAGFVTIRITWERLHEHPCREAARLRRILASRASEPAPRFVRRSGLDAVAPRRLGALLELAVELDVDALVEEAQQSLDPTDSSSGSS